MTIKLSQYDMSRRSAILARCSSCDSWSSDHIRMYIAWLKTMCWDRLVGLPEALIVNYRTTWRTTLILKCYTYVCFHTKMVHLHLLYHYKKFHASSINYRSWKSTNEHTVVSNNKWSLAQCPIRKLIFTFSASNTEEYFLPVSLVISLRKSLFCWDVWPSKK